MCCHPDSGDGAGEQECAGKWQENAFDPGAHTQYRPERNSGACAKPVKQGNNLSGSQNKECANEKVWRNTGHLLKAENTTQKETGRSPKESPDRWRDLLGMGRREQGIG